MDIDLFEACECLPLLRPNASRIERLTGVVLNEQYDVPVVRDLFRARQCTSGLTGIDNVNYPTAIKRVIGMVPLPEGVYYRAF